MQYTGATLPTTQCRTDLTNFYTFAFDGTPDASTYTLQATAQGVQASADSACTPLSVTQTGARTPTTGGCW
jgi:type IV pilus assembly protein PilE